MNYYSIIIPIQNEIESIPPLLSSLKDYSKNNHEIIIIDDGSTDGSGELLKNYDYIKVIDYKVNKGKGYAIKKGLAMASNEKIIIFDGDMELNPEEIKMLMILDREKGINSVMGSRYQNINPIKSLFDCGNFMFTTLFNLSFKSHHKDILCCAKSFYINQIDTHKLESCGFDIDVELASFITIKSRGRRINQVFLNYKRRNIDEGKKLKISDGWFILNRIIKTIKYI